MVRLDNRHFLKKVHVKNYSGGSLLQIANVPGMILSKHDLSHLIKTLGGFNATSIAMHRAYQLLAQLSEVNLKHTPLGPMHNPMLTVNPGPQGTLKNDMLPISNIIERVDPKNSAIKLTDGQVKLNVKVEPYHKSDGMPQGTLRGDMLPAKNSIQIVNPDNHEIELADGNIRNKNEPYHKKKIYAKSGEGLNRMLTAKSKDILKSLTTGAKKGAGLNRM